MTDDAYERLAQRNAELMEEKAVLAAALDASEQLAERLRQEAVNHAMEARAQRATVQEIYRLISGGKGEPGDWHGSEPVRKLVAERDALAAHVERLREGLGQALTAWAYEAAQGDGIMEEHGNTYVECEKRCDETPTASLACLKAQWQAEALEEAAALYSHEWKDEFAGVAVSIMRKGRGYIYPEGLAERAAELHRQAEGGE